MFKLSQYNHFVPWRDGQFLAYNARSGAVALLSSENFASLTRLTDKIASSQTDHLGPEEQQLLKQLQYGQFVYPEDQPESVCLRFESQRARFDQSSLGLVVAPTLACNMACVYCYEKDKKGRMSQESQDALLGFIERRAAGLKELMMTWYGGEPLLALDIIAALTDRILDLATKHGFTYKAIIITNGYLLNAETVDRLLELKVYGAQVTLDGPSRIHNQMRPLINGRPSFDTIIQNLRYAAGRLALGVRVNIDKGYSPDVVSELLDELDAAGLRNSIGVNFALMEPATEVCSDIRENCYDTSGFSEVETTYYTLLLDRGFRMDRIPSPTTAACMAQLVNAFVIDPEGYLYRCFNYVGDKARSCGTTREEINFLHPEFLRLFTFDPFENERCRECNVLPLCQGGCPSRRFDRNLNDEQQCESWRFNLLPMLDLVARSCRPPGTTSPNP